MNEDLELAPEIERYELFADPTYNFGFDRRQFLKAFSGGIALIVPVSNLVARTLQQEQGESGSGRFNERVPNEIGAWIHIDEKGTVSVFTGKVEIGQNIRTSLTQAVAEELHVPLTTVRLVMADTDLTPFDMGTFGSLTTPRMAPQLRKAAAAARETLIALAAEQWKVETSTVRRSRERSETGQDDSGGCRGDACERVDHRGHVCSESRWSRFRNRQTSIHV
jgi:isoquinoline 1-oxidoreductase